MRSTDLQQGSYFRTERFFCVNQQWFFSTREGRDCGPYSSRDRAEEGLNKFIALVEAKIQGRYKPGPNLSLVPM